MDRRILLGALAGALFIGKEAVAAPLASQSELGDMATPETTEVKGGRGHGGGHGRGHHGNRGRHRGWYKGRGHAWGRRRRHGW